MVNVEVQAVYRSGCRACLQGCLKMAPRQVNCARAAVEAESVERLLAHSGVENENFVQVVYWWVGRCAAGAAEAHCDACFVGYLAGACCAELSGAKYSVVAPPGVAYYVAPPGVACYVAPPGGAYSVGFLGGTYYVAAPGVACYAVAPPGVACSVAPPGGACCGAPPGAACWVMTPAGQDYLYVDLVGQLAPELPPGVSLGHCAPCPGADSGS